MLCLGEARELQKTREKRMEQRDMLSWLPREEVEVEENEFFESYD